MFPPRPCPPKSLLHVEDDVLWGRAVKQMVNGRREVSHIGTAATAASQIPAIQAAINRAVGLKGKRLLGQEQDLGCRSPDQLRGRVMSVYSLVFGGMSPIGGLYAGQLTESHGSSFSLLISGVVGLFAAGFAGVMLRRGGRGRNMNVQGS